VTRYSHCPACGKPYGPADAGAATSRSDLLLCPSCGFQFWQNSKPAVAALVVRPSAAGPQILLSRRGAEPFRGLWDFPGGFLSNGELPEDGLARELREELDVSVLRPRLFAFGIEEYPAEGTAEQARFVLSIYYRCELPPGAALSARDDVAEVRWFPVGAPPDMAFAADARTLRDLIRVLNEEWAARGARS